MQPGVTDGAIGEAVAPLRLFFPLHPASDDISTIGKMIANDASGMQSVKYGEVGGRVRGFNVVSPTVP